MGLLTLEATGSEGERLALAAGETTGIPVGWDADSGSGTFDSDELEGAELEAVVFDALNGIDPEWRDHLQVAE